MSGTINQKEWDELSGDEKLARLEPRIILLLKLLRESYQVLKDNDLVFDDLKKGMEILNLET